MIGWCKCFLLILLMRILWMLVLVLLMLGLKVKFESGFVHCCGICVCDLLQTYKSPLFLLLFHLVDGGAEGRKGMEGRGWRFVFFKKKNLKCLTNIYNLFSVSLLKLTCHLIWVIRTISLNKMKFKVSKPLL